MRQPVTDDGTFYDFETFCEACADRSQTLSTRVDILLNGSIIQQRLAVGSGQLTTDRRAAHAGRVSGLEILEPTLVPTSSGGVLSPAGYEVRVWRGLRIDGVDVRCSLGVFGISTASVDSETGYTTIEGWDRSRRIADNTLIDSYQWLAGGPLEVYIADLVFRALPFVGEQVLYSFEGFQGHTTQLTTFERDADTWKIIQDAAGSIGYEAMFDGDGTFRWRPEPDFRNVDPICDVHESEPGVPGVLLRLDPNYSRDNAYNYWVVIGESASDDTEIVGTAIDNDPNSLTYYYGNFGPKPAPPYRSKSVASTLDATAAAEALKAASLGIARSIDFSLVPNPALEPGDAVSLRRSKVSIDETMLIDSLTVGLGPDEAMTGQVRARQDLT